MALFFSELDRINVGISCPVFFLSTVKTHKTVLKTRLYLSVGVEDILSAPVCVRWRTGRCDYAQAGLRLVMPV